MNVSTPSSVKFTIHKPAWIAVWAMSMCAMVLVASEFLPVSLLTPIAKDLNISEGTAGQSISISGLFALITSLFLTTVIGNFDRRHMVLFFTILMAVAGIMVSFAANATILMIGRAILGVCVGGFWSISAALVMRLVPADSVPRALAILNGGNALSTTIAAPLGSFLGSIIGWRGAFFCIVPLAVIAFVWQWFSIPALPPQHQHGQKETIGSTFKVLAQRKVALGMVSVMLFFTGQFAVFTYLRPFLETVTNVTVEQLSFVLLTMGLSGLAGTFIVGEILKKQLFSIIIVTPLLMAVIVVGIIAFGHSLAATIVLIAAWGFFATSAPVAWWTWLSKTLPDNAEAGGGLMVAIIQLAITIGAAGGGLIFDNFGYKNTFELSVAILLLSAIMGIVTWRHSISKPLPVDSIQRA